MRLKDRVKGNSNNVSVNTEQSKPVAKVAIKKQLEKKEKPKKVNKKAKTEKAKKMPLGYSKNVLRKLKTSSPRVQGFYSDLRNELGQYPDFKFKSTNSGDTYSFKGKVVLKVTVFPRALKIYFALDPKKYEVKKYHHKDMSELKRYESIPLMMRASSDRSFKYILDLSKDLIKELGLKKEKINQVNFKDDFKTTSKDLLIELGGEELLRASCAKSEANVISDSLAKKCLLLDNREQTQEEKKIAEISIGELSAAFNSSYVIDLKLLKEIGLVEPDVTHLKVNANNNCYHAITIKADEFDPEVINMVVVTGGTIIKMVN